MSIIRAANKKESLRDSRLFSEGLENKWYKEIQQASLPDVFEAIKASATFIAVLNELQHRFYFHQNWYLLPFLIPPSPNMPGSLL